MLQSLIAGYLLSISLIMAIGAQNAFVLRQGLRGQFVLPVVLTCALSDLILIVAGVTGFGALVVAFPMVVTLAKWGGAAFLFVYGAMNFRSAFRGGDALAAEGRVAQTVGAALGTCLLLTWANPHVYLDTVVLLGGLSAQYASAAGFAIGAALGSFSFFFALGYGARLLRPLFTSAKAWRILDALIGVVMWAIALSLLMMS
ncbi:LysE/ArgO family amino acid transporter [Cognatishimia sp. SS12]|uniref:LysE/ArgO family amino acid transporter n=1 Tax=Cognatishimia sp. SS12 TaxID=2979465 RepID=UPI00232D0D04|nr:LysE/ArgO family amino acid transporter [Cognatishimia sp. SS12]MDC0738604.1 LysE/ArgO family amino acid transporter [Cognatishimia sp. SS12]